MSEDPAKPPRFPYIAALLCVACLGAAGWTWTRYSYCWLLPTSCLPMHFLLPPDSEEYAPAVLSLGCETGADNLPRPDAPQLRSHRWAEGRYICFEVPLRLEDSSEVVLLPGRRQVALCTAVINGGSSDTLTFLVFLSPEDAAQRVGEPLEVRGRILSACHFYREGHATHIPFLGPFIDTTTSRFTGASIAGLVVGAMGMFVFSVALRHWLGERRRFREGTEGA